MSSEEKDLLLNNNRLIPQFALGTYQISDDQMSEVIGKALKVGYRHIDCAWIYQNEKSLGDVLNDQMKKGQIKRSDLFLTSKLWCSFHRSNRVRQQCLVTIENLQCQYLDLFLIHWPFAFRDQDPNDETAASSIEIDDQIDFIESWKTMELLVDEGFVKSIGLSNFNEQQIERILQICKYKPVVNQVEIHPYCPQLQLEEFCRKHHILLEGYACLGGANNQLTNEQNCPNLLHDPVIQSLATKYQVDTSDILLRYILDRKLICIVKSSNLQRVEKNFRLFQEKRFHLNEEDLREIHQKISIRYRYYLMEDGIKAKLHPFPQWKQFIPNNQ